MDVESDLQEIYDKVDSPDAAANAEEAADTAAPSAETADAEPENPETDAESEEVDEEADQADSKAADDAAEESEPPETSESETFQDLLEDIPSTETILATHKRIPQETKDALVQYADGWRGTKEKLDQIGGEKGVEILRPVADVMLNPEPDEQARTNAWTSISAANPETGFLMMMDAAEFLMNDDPRPHFKAVAEKGDMVLQRAFGTGMTADHIRQLRMLEEGGYIDVTGDLELLNSEGEASTLFQKQNEKIAGYEAKIDELTNLVQNPEQIVQQSDASRSAVKEFEAELQERIAQGITPFRERGRWGEDSALTKLTLKALMAELKDSGEYKEALKFVRANGALKQGDAIPFPVEQKLYTLVNKAKGRFGEDVMAINKELRKLQETSRNAEVKQEAKETKPKAVDVTDNHKPFGGGVVDPDLEAIYAKTRAAVGR